ncbi:hypothetical protein ALC57_07578 [Trachymyrmex cornetzi]|uniref:Uncharacterized protein n=1 Tax=Trachymyrmex cornetzi TaxID=471704 RepID=A0A151J7W5_9HYME|nr:hypothetical protein ALC57_07578 [Trachymyrmex cornetzi]
MSHHNPLATLKYAVEAVPFFDGQNIPITYFIERCEEAKSMLPPEAESQFTKIIRTRIIGEAQNPKIKIGYIPRMKIAHGIYLRDTIVENVSGKAYLNVISTLDKEVEVQVPILRLKPLDELFDNNKLNDIETQDDRTEIANTQVHFTNPNNQERNEVPYCDADLENDEYKNVNNNTLTEKNS